MNTQIIPCAIAALAAYCAILIALHWRNVARRRAARRRSFLDRNICPDCEETPIAPEATFCLDCGLDRQW